MKLFKDQANFLEIRLVTFFFFPSIAALGSEENSTSCSRVAFLIFPTAVGQPITKVSIFMASIKALLLPLRAIFIQEATVKKHAPQRRLHSNKSSTNLRRRRMQRFKIVYSADWLRITMVLYLTVNIGQCSNVSWLIGHLLEPTQNLL